MSVRQSLGKVAVVPKGSWDGTNTYEFLDIVKYGGGSYIARKDVPIGTAITNTEYWVSLVDKGEIGDDGVSPSVTVTPITGGHRVTITDAEHPQGQSIDVMDGEVNNIDPTLTISGAAADAKAVGDAVDTLNDLLEVSEIPIEVSGTEYQGFYLNESSQIKSIANTAFRVIKYPVTEGVKYNVHGTQCKLPLAVYPMAGFDTVDFTGSETVACDATIISPGETNVSKNYDIDYVAPANGYIYVWYSTTATANHLYVAECVTASGRIKDKKALKIQLFGDSITDDIWGDQTTWATILQNYMSDYDLTIINSAVAGSAIGYRGKSSSGRYADKTYNYVCDLMVDGTLDTTADVVVILIGTNNYGGSYPRIGVLGDCGVINEDQSGTGFNIYGSAQFITNKVTADTHALLLWVTPPQRYNSFDQNQPVNSLGEPLNNLNYTLRELSDALVDCANFNGVPCLNLTSSLGWNKRNVAYFTGDGLHPNTTGDEWLAQIISSEIKKHLHN